MASHNYKVEQINQSNLKDLTKEGNFYIYKLENEVSIVKLGYVCETAAKEIPIKLIDRNNKEISILPGENGIFETQNEKLNIQGYDVLDEINNMDLNFSGIKFPKELEDFVFTFDFVITQI